MVAATLTQTLNINLDVPVDVPIEPFTVAAVAWVQGNIPHLTGSQPKVTGVTVRKGPERGYWIIFKVTVSAAVVGQEGATKLQERLDYSLDTVEKLVRRLAEEVSFFDLRRAIEPPGEQLPLPDVIYDDVTSLYSCDSCDHPVYRCLDETAMRKHLISIHVLAQWQAGDLMYDALGGSSSEPMRMAIPRLTFDSDSHEYLCRDCDDTYSRWGGPMKGGGMATHLKSKIHDMNHSGALALLAAAKENA